jgi:RNA polymerase sigma-70 factor, ECF subfamily
MCEQALVAAAKQGQVEALGALCQPLARKLIHSAQRITRNREDAEDALQDAFLSAFIHIKNFDGRSSFSTWLTRIAINSALMTLRKKRSSQEVPVGSGELGADGDTRTRKCSGNRSPSCDPPFDRLLRFNSCKKSP